MTEMRKIRAIVFEDNVDHVIRTLGQAGIVQLIDMRDKLDTWGGQLVPCSVSAETLARCSEMLSKIDAYARDLNLKPEAMASVEVPIPSGTSEEVLGDVERGLAKLPVEAFARTSAALSRIDQLAEALQLEPTEEIAVVPEKPIEETLEDIESGLSEIEKAASTARLTERKSLSDRMKALSLEEKIEVSQRILELRKFVADTQMTLGRQLLRLRRLAEITKRSLEEKMKLGEISEDLLRLKKTVQREKEIAEAEGKVARTAKTIYFEAWVPGTHLKEATERIRSAARGNCVVTEEAVSHDEKPPTASKSYPDFLQAFEKLTFAFGQPSSGEINPIPIAAITFPLLFGIMFADVGQGALFVIVGALLAVMRRKVGLEGVGDIVRYLLISGEMFILCGLSAVFWGFVFGEFFGPSGFVHPIALGSFGPFYFGGFEPTHEPLKMLRFAILVGVIHLSLGLALKFINDWRRGHRKRAPVAICWLWLLLGGFFMWVNWGGISNISRWFAEGMSHLAGLVIAPLMLVILFTGIAEGFMEGIGFGVEVFAESLSHTLSYGRLMALGLVHSVMNYLFLVLGGVEHGHFPPMSVPIVATGTVLVMIIEGLIVFVHTLRLHWIEWFSKFYSGEGIPFKPFKLA